MLTSETNSEEMEKIINNLLNDELSFDEFKKQINIIKKNSDISKKILVNEFQKNVKIMDTMYDYATLIYLISELECENCVDLLVKFMNNDNDSLQNVNFYEIEIDKILYSLLKTPEDKKYFLDLFYVLDNGVQSHIISTSFSKFEKCKVIKKELLDTICENLLNKIINKYGAICINIVKNNIFDTSDEDMLISSIMEYYVEQQMFDKLPIIKMLYDNNIAHKRIIGDYMDVENMMYKREKQSIIKPSKTKKKSNASKNKEEPLKNMNEQIKDDEINKEIVDNEEIIKLLKELHVDIIKIYSNYSCYKK